MQGDEIIEFLVERRSADTLAGIVNLNLDLSFFHDYGHDALIVHIQTGHTNGIKQTCKAELTMDDIARVNVLQLLVLDGFQV